MSLPTINQSTFELLLQNSSLSSTQARKIRKYIHNSPDDYTRQLRYSSYLSSVVWMNRISIISRKECMMCAAQHDNDVYHISYARLGQESNRDLIVLCKSCQSTVVSKKTSIKTLRHYLKVANIHVKNNSDVKKIYPRNITRTQKSRQSQEQRRENLKKLKSLTIRPKGMPRKEWYALHPNPICTTPKGFSTTYCPTGIPLRPDIHQLNQL